MYKEALASSHGSNCPLEPATLTATTNACAHRLCQGLGAQQAVSSSQSTQAAASRSDQVVEASKIIIVKGTRSAPADPLFTTTSTRARPGPAAAPAWNLHRYN